MIKSFNDKQLERCWREGKCKGITGSLRRRVLRKLDMIDAASSIDDLKHPPGNHLHELKGKYKGFYSISVNGPWRLIFTTRNADVFDVILIQYH